MLKYEVIRNYCTLRYFRHGEYHRKNDSAFVWNDGDVLWYEYGAYHRKDGCAVKFNSGYTQHFIRGEHVKISSKI